jgi:hypothetical protein
MPMGYSGMNGLSQQVELMLCILMIRGRSFYAASIQE